MDKDFEICGIRTSSGQAPKKSDHYWAAVGKRFLGKTKAKIALAAIGILILLALFAPLFSGYRYDEIISASSGEKTIIASGISPTFSYQAGEDSGEKAVFNGKTFLFGTDDLGRDLWTRTWRGCRVSLIIAFVTLFIDMIIGTVYGLISGYAGGWVDSLMQHFVEIVSSIPTLVIVSVLAIFMPKGMGLVIVAIILTHWINISKIARAQMLKLKNMEYIDASRTLGTGHLGIIFNGILPNTAGPLITQMLFSIPAAIFTEAFLSFVGVGITLPNCSIGSLIQTGFNNISTLPYQILPPTIVLAVLMLSFSVIGDSLKEAFKPGAEDL